jgi:quercetin dioxygenase-like cupin family protein
MKTIHISGDEMAKRVSRFNALQPLPIQSNTDVPQEARDVVYARTIYSIIGLDGNVTTPVNVGAPIRGAGGMTLAIAVCPPGQGPGLHSHQATYETFTVLRGRFEVTWNDNGEDALVLDTFDTISVPPGVCRAFRNIGNDEGMLQVIITGGVHDMNDIAFARRAKSAIEAVRPGLAREFEKVGFTFNAGEA